MKPKFVRADSHLAYLEPPHSHDPTSVSTIASLPLTFLADLPDEVQSALYSLSQSTSIVYASLLRLQELLEERFERLLPSIDEDGEMTFSESSFFNYVNSLCAERTYLLSDAHPDWRHKASVARIALQPYSDQGIGSNAACPDAPGIVSEWWTSLESTVESWCEYARAVHVPDYEDTVSEFQAISKHEPSLAVDVDDSPLESPLATPTLASEKEPVTFQIDEIKEHFTTSALSDNANSTKIAGLGLTDTFPGMAPREFALRDEGKARDERKDSGVEMADGL